jgi:hypothetical protein
MITDPAINIAAPTHHKARKSQISPQVPKEKKSMEGNSPGSSSPKTTLPRTAVATKFALVLITLTCTLLVAKVKARVKSAHIRPLKEIFKRRNPCHEN